MKTLYTYLKKNNVTILYVFTLHKCRMVTNWVKAIGDILLLYNDCFILILY